MKKNVKLSYKLSIRIIFVIVAVQLILGIFLISRFSGQLEEFFNKQISIPGYLVAERMLNYESIENREMLETIIGDKVDAGAVIGLNGQIYYSTNKAEIGKGIWEFPEIYETGSFKEDLDKMVIDRVKFNGRKYFVATSPIKLENENIMGYFYLRVQTKAINREKSFLILIFVLTSFIAILIISALVIYISGQLITKRINSLLKVANEINKGNLKYDLKTTDANDELWLLENKFSQLLISLRTISTFANEIKKQNFDFKYRLLSDEDEIGKSLMQLRDSLQEAIMEENERKERDEIQNWITEGIAKFAEILRKDNDDLKKLGYNIISSLIEYLGANQGGFFLIKEEDAEKHIELVAAYAFNKQKYIQKKIEWGTGLLGNTIIEGKTQYLKNIPDNYISITSGLGDSNPRCLLIVPLISNNITYGAIELASFSEFKQHQIDFVNRLSESIASTISTVQINMQTSYLYKETHEQTERIKQNEEEMRQHLEEMLATQEEASRREKELNDELEEAKSKIRKLENELSKNK